MKSSYSVLVSQWVPYKRLTPFQAGRYCSHQSMSQWNSSLSLILWWRWWALMDVLIMQWRKALPGLYTWHTKWSLPTKDKIVCLVADQRPEMSLSREIVSERWLGYGFHCNWINVYPKEIYGCSRFCDFFGIEGKTKLLTHCNHGHDDAGTNWGVQWTNSEVIIQLV